MTADLVAGAVAAAVLLAGVAVGQMAAWAYRREGLSGAIRAALIFGGIVWGAVGVSALALIGLLALLGWWP